MFKIYYLFPHLVRSTFSECNKGQTDSEIQVTAKLTDIAS